ncbi:hypothetical protein [Halocola ammonii]
MIKYPVMLLFLAGSLLINFFMADGLVIEDNTPARLAPGESKDVTITINKGQVTGFAKLQLDLPVGLTAEAVETRGASFTFSNQKAKFIWMSLPKEQEFSVTYTLTAKNNASGNKVITGVFSYIKDNQRQDYDMQSKIVTVGEGENQGVSDSGKLTATREINQISDDQYLVTIQVSNSNLKGFTKILEELPTGYRIDQDKNNGASVTIDNRSIKFVWFEAPSSESFSVSYMVNKTSTLADPIKINGTMAYVENNIPKEIPIGVQGEVVEPLADDTDDESDDEDGDLTANDSGKDKTAADGDKGQKDTDTKDTDQKPTDKPYEIPEPEEGIAYRVQIAAGPNEVGKVHFKKAHNFTEPFNIEQYGSLYKYTTGSWPVYKQCRDDRERIKARYNFRGPFVTAYNDGVRITVQEALMITNQRWYK